MTSPAPRPTRSKLPPAVWLLGLTSFFTDVGGELIFPLLPGFLAALGGLPLLGLIEGLADATSALLKIPAGALSDRLPRRKPLVLVGYGLAGAVRPLMAIVAAPWQAMLVRVADRVGKGIRSSPRDALIADVAPLGQEGRAFGVHRALDHAGAIVGPLLATALISAGLLVTEVFLVAAIPGALAFLVLLLVKERRVERAPKHTAPAAPAPLPPRLKSFIAVMVVFAIAGSTDAFLLVRAEELGVTKALLPLLWVALHIVRFVSSWAFGALADRVPRTTLIAWGFAVYALCYALLGLASAPWHVWAVFLVYGTYSGLAEPAESALVRTLAPDAGQGRAFGWYHGMVGVAAIPAGLLTGYLWSAASPAVALFTDAGIALVALGMLLAWSRRAPVS